MGQSKRE